jgi:hypothetical protein
MCFWTFPNPHTHGKSTNHWELLQNETANFCIPIANWGTASKPVISPVWWNGGVFARTGCQPDGTGCATGDCTTLPTPLPNKNCPPGQGGSNPYSQAEFTLQVTAADYYDVTLINGVNTTVTMAPNALPAKAPSSGDANYWCTTPGASTSSGLQACTWVFNPVIPPASGKGTGTDQTTLLLYSSLSCSTANNPTGCPKGLQCSGAPGGCYQACSSNSDCPGTFSCTNSYCQCASNNDCASLGLPAAQQYCGTQLIPGVAGLYQQQCGAFAGWWSAFDFCGGQVTSIGPLNCTASITDGNGNSQTTLVNLFQCQVPNQDSCYNTTSGATTCCGCATSTANSLSKDWPPAATGVSCDGNDTTWASQVQPWLVYLKQGCPTAYSYPFDDATSTFQCQTTGATNMVGYTITMGTLNPPAASSSKK